MHHMCQFKPITDGCTVQDQEATLICDWKLQALTFKCRNDCDFVLHKKTNGKESGY